MTARYYRANILLMDIRLSELDDESNKLLHHAYIPFLITFLISGAICLVALRHNNSTMIKLRQDVYTADENNGDVNAALNKLRDYIYGHMNTDLSTGTNIRPPVQLRYTYARLESAAQQQASNTDLYNKAVGYCEKTVPTSASPYLVGQTPCVSSYILSHGGKQVAPVPVGLYEFDFASPRWSPDLAGWSLIVAAVSFMGLVISFIVAMFKRNQLPEL